MAALNSGQLAELTFLTGVNANGVAAGQSFWSWNDDSPATYSSRTEAAKFGSGTPGTGATISYAFDPASNWTATEKDAFLSSFALWSSVANVRFVEGNASTAQIDIVRGSDDSAMGGQDRYRASSIGSSQIGVATSGFVSIDTSVASFGPLGTAFDNYGGYPWMTVLHEIGHVLGLGHGGPYDSGSGVTETMYSAYDTIAWTIMSYNGENDGGGSHSWGTSRADNGLRYGNVPTTWMPLDIVAIQRLYGVATDTPLSGGQTYGFHSTIDGAIAKYFDFTINTKPIVTLWSKGAGNTLDLSGFSQASRVDLHEGAFSSAGGLSNNIAIAFDTKMEKVITGSGDDVIVTSDSHSIAMGGLGADSITGGSGHDRLYGGSSPAVAGDGNDTIDGGAGNDYIQGNAGDDLLSGGLGKDKIQGGQGNDRLSGGAGDDSMNGNLGNDIIDGGDGSDSLRGGQGDDSIAGGSGSDSLFGDLGRDTLSGGAGVDKLTGGGDADVFQFAVGDALFASGSGRGQLDAIADFTDGQDKISLDFGTPMVVLQAGSFASIDAAAAGAQSMIDAQIGRGAAMASVGSDSFLFYDGGAGHALEAVWLIGVTDPGLVTVSDFI